MSDRVANLYFAARERRLRELGLDPDNDEHWAIPDYELPGLYELDDGDFDYHPPAPELDPYGQPFIAMCDDCLDSPAIINDAGDGHVCEVCQRRRERRGL